MSLSEHRSKVIVISFWSHEACADAALCTPASALVKRMEGKPFVLSGVNLDADRETVKKVVKQEGLTWRSWWDSAETGSPISTQFEVFSPPG